jgi:hypothetical protein
VLKQIIKAGGEGIITTVSLLTLEGNELTETKNVETARTCQVKTREERD